MVKRFLFAAAWGKRKKKRKNFVSFKISRSRLYSNRKSVNAYREREREREAATDRERLRSRQKCAKRESASESERERYVTVVARSLNDVWVSFQKSIQCWLFKILGKKKAYLFPRLDSCINSILRVKKILITAHGQARNE